MRIYCTIFDSGYLPRALALYRSMERHCADRTFLLFGLCMDDEAHRVVKALALPRLETLRRVDVEDEDLRRACADRNIAETCWTFTPVVLRAAMQHVGPALGRVTYLDADSLFFSSPESLFAELDGAGAVIALPPHRFPERLVPTHSPSGRFNVNVTSFSWAPESLECLREWEALCRSWCYGRYETVNGQPCMGDQLYWDRLASRYPVHPVRHIGVNLAPWNMEQYVFGDGPTVDGVPVILHHFHEFRKREDGTYRLTNYPVTPDQRRLLYEPYVAAYEAAEKEILDAITAAHLRIPA